VLRGDRVGILGPNGCGKTTLLRTLLGKMEPSAGSVRLGTRIEVAYFDQLRDQLDPEKTVADNVADGAERVQVGDTSRHVLGYLEDFLFPPERARSPVSSLSGGERNRLLLARLFLRSSNLMVLDEPTNDLDVATLELLEQKLIGYGGTVLVVSHDRTFLDNVVTSTLAHEGAGRFVEYAGGYSDRLAQRGAAVRGAQPTAAGAKTKHAKRKMAKARKLSFKEKNELKALPAQIEALELEQGSLHERMAEPDFYREQGAAVAKAKERLTCIEAELKTTYARWQMLEEIPAD
jgi:ATP-binding cassette subfamily F protein uup